MSDLSRTVGTNQKRLRSERGMSLDALAKASGVSRTRLVQIENGDANPSIGTVWQIASALMVEFSAMVTEPNERSEVVRLSDIEPMTGETEGLRTYLLFPFDPAFGFESYFSTVDPGGSLMAAPHTAGTQETLIVVEGSLTLDLSGEVHHLSEGDAIRFRADQPHGYRNDGDGLVRFTMTVAYPR